MQQRSAKRESSAVGDASGGKKAKLVAAIGEHLDELPDLSTLAELEPGSLGDDDRGLDMIQVAIIRANIEGLRRCPHCFW
jgi:hypothetical protein